MNALTLALTSALVQFCLAGDGRWCFTVDRSGPAAGASSAKEAEILKIDPAVPEALGPYATLALDAGDVSGAIQGLQLAIASMPNNFVAHYNLYRAYMKSGDWQSARGELETTRELPPDYARTQRAMNEFTEQQQKVQSGLRSKKAPGTDDRLRKPAIPPQIPK